MNDQDYGMYTLLENPKMEPYTYRTELEQAKSTLLEADREITRLRKSNAELRQENEALDVLVTRAEKALEILAQRFSALQIEIGYARHDTADSLAASAYAEAVRQESKK
jgi:hypothetical protein